MSIKTDDGGVAASIDLLSRTALREVFDEVDAGRRVATIARIFAEDARFIDHLGAHVGREAINAAVEQLHTQLPGFRFKVIREPQILPGAARLGWQFGPPEEPARVTGTDTILVQDGRISVLVVFLDHAPA